MIRPELHPGHPQQSQADKEWQGAGDGMKLRFVAAVLPEKVADVGLCPPCIPAVNGKMILELGSNYPQVVHKICMLH